jgi:hypothetical protein
LIKIFTTSIFYLKLKENNENNMVAHAFWAVFCSSQPTDHISPTAENDGAAVPTPIFFLAYVMAIVKVFLKHYITDMRIKLMLGVWRAPRIILPDWGHPQIILLFLYKNILSDLNNWN